MWTSILTGAHFTFLVTLRDKQLLLCCIYWGYEFWPFCNERTFIGSCLYNVPLVLWSECLVYSLLATYTKYKLVRVVLPYANPPQSRPLFTHFTQCGRVWSHLILRFWSKNTSNCAYKRTAIKETSKMKASYVLDRQNIPSWLSSYSLAFGPSAELWLLHHFPLIDLYLLFDKEPFDVSSETLWKLGPKLYVRNKVIFWYA